MLSEKVGAAEDGDQALCTEQDWKGPSISEVLLLLRIEELRSEGGVETTALTDGEFSASSPDATDTQTGKLNQGAERVPSDLSEESPVRTSEASPLLLNQIASAPEERVADQPGESEDAGTAGEPDHDPSASFDAIDAEHAEINSEASADGDPVDAVLIERGSEAPGPPLPAASSELDDFMKDGGEVDDGLSFWAEESSNQAQGEDADRITSASSTPPTYEHEIGDGIGLKQVAEPEELAEPEEVAGQEPLATARQATPKADAVRSWPSAAPSLRRTRILGMDDSIRNRDWTPWVVAGALLLLLLVLVSIPRGLSKRAEDLASSSRPNAAQVGAVESGSAGGARSAFVSVRLLKCRASPGRGARVAGILPRGAPIKVLATDRGWASIAYRGRQCWAWARYITTERPL